MKKIALIVLVLLIAAVAYLIMAKPRFEIRITAEQIQSQLEKNFPYEQTHLFLVKTVFSNPQVRLENGKNRIGLAFDTSVSMAGVETLKSKIDVETGIRYDSDSQSIFLAAAELNDFQLQGIPGDTEKVVQEIVGQAVLDILALRPIYKFDKPGTKEKFVGTFFLKDIKVKDGTLNIVFGL